MGHIDLTAVNADLGRNAAALVEWALGLGKTSIVTTNFRPFEAVILHMVTQVTVSYTHLTLPTKRIV